jgi:hypothetical protein
MSGGAVLMHIFLMVDSGKQEKVLDMVELRERPMMPKKQPMQD